MAVAAYELLAGEKPFPGDTPGEILKKQLDRSSFIPPRQHNPDVPPAMEKVILRCLERDPPALPLCRDNGAGSPSGVVTSESGVARSLVGRLERRHNWPVVRAHAQLGIAST